MKHSLANTDEHDTQWHCPDCATVIHLHPNEDHESNDWTRDFLKEHLYVHEENLANSHDGHRGSLRLALKYPHIHAAVVKVYGPIKDLTDEHQVQIYEAAGIQHNIILPPPPLEEPEPVTEPGPEYPLNLDYDQNEIPEY